MLSSTFNASSSSTVYVFDNLTSKLGDLPFEITATGQIIETGEASKSDHMELFCAIEDAAEQSTCVFNFKRGDCWLLIDGRYGDKAKFLRDAFGQDKGDKLYNTYCKCAVVAKKFPPAYRDYSRPWTFYRNSSTSPVLTPPNTREANTSPRGTMLPLYLNGVEHPVAKLVIQKERIVVVVDKKVMSIGRERVEVAIASTWPTAKLWIDGISGGNENDDTDGFADREYKEAEHGNISK